MLFDLRGRGRRRTVRVVYLGLALLFLLGFVGFGVGVGGGGGGIFNALTENSGSSGASFAGKVAAAQKRTKTHPSEPAAWAALAEAQLHQASEAEYFSQSAEQYTAKGRQLLAEVGRSWNAYLKLEAHHPSTELAQRMASVYAEQGLNQPAEAARALKIAIVGNPGSAGLYSSLAVYAYKARDLKGGDAAASKAVALAPSAERSRVKKYLAELRTNPLSHTPTTISKGPKGELIATQAGKTFTVKKGPNGSYVGVTTGAATAVPSGHSSSTSTATKK
ncbi:MAG TPA: hypothetical protein VNY52_05220 [Solirubrobacteraceae bacterium]|jgi:hypothetical protein|nr:hypothetical protein [Solirubrobacteraceae bacterium]